MQSKFVKLFSVIMVALFASALITACAAKKGPETSESPATQTQNQTKAEKTTEKTASKTTSAVPSGMNVSNAVIATAIEERQPQGVAQSFDPNVEKVYCYTKIEGGSQGSQIHHVWKHDGDEVANVKLNVNGETWRTYSSKVIEPNRTGSWTVEIQDAQGNLLKEVPFQVSSTQASENQ
jgi:hypothetical protein